MITGILSVLVIVGGLVAGVLHKKGAKAADTVDVVVGVLRQLLGVLQGSSDPVLQSKASAVRSLVERLEANPNDQVALARARAIAEGKVRL